MSKITQYVRHLAVVAIATLLAQVGWAVDGLNYTWRSGWDADPAQTVSYGAYTGENGILFAGQQMGIVAQVKLVSNVSANIINFGGDNRVVLATDADGKYTLSSNVSALNGHTSETAATTGWHRYSMFVRRGVNGSGHAASVIVYEDGNVIFKITNGSFVTGPFRNLTIGGKQGNLAKGGHWSAHLSAGAATADEATAAAIEADCVKMYPPVDETIVAKIGETGYQTLEAAMTYATENATAEAPIAVKLVAPHTGNVTIPENVTVEMTTDNRIIGAVSGAGTVKLSHATTATQGNLTTWVGEGKMTFGEFTGTVHLASGRFETSDTVGGFIPATAKIKVTNGSQLSIYAGTWACDIEIEGAGYGSETAAIGRAAFRYEGGTINGTVYTTGTGDNAPAIGSHNQSITFPFAIAGSGDLRLVRGTGALTYTFSNTSFTGALTIVDANLTVKGTFTNNAIKGDGTIILDGAIPTTVNALNDNAWTGTLWVKNYTGVLKFKDWTRAGLTIKLTNVAGWLFNGAPDQTGPILELVDEGENVALHLTDGSAYFFKLSGLKGSGTLKITGADTGRNRRYAIASVADFTGSVIIDESMTNARVLLGGTDENPTAAGAIVVRTPVTTTGTLSAKNGIVLATETATLTVPAELATAPTTTVSGKKVVFDDESKTYTLADANVTIAIPTIEHTTFEVIDETTGDKISVDETGAITVAPGTTVTIVYLADDGYAGSGYITVTIESAQTEISTKDVVIVEAVAQIYYKVVSGQDEYSVGVATLKDAFTSALGINTHLVKLLKDVTLDETLEIPATFSGRIDFNGYLVSGAIADGAVVKVANGSTIYMGNDVPTLGGIANTAGGFSIENVGQLKIFNIDLLGDVNTTSTSTTAYGFTLIEASFDPSLAVTFKLDVPGTYAKAQVGVAKTSESANIVVDSAMTMTQIGDLNYLRVVQTTETTDKLYDVALINAVVQIAPVTFTTTNATVADKVNVFETVPGVPPFAYVGQSLPIKFAVTPDEGYEVTSVTADGVELTANEEGKYVVEATGATLSIVVTTTEKSYVAQIGEKKYETLQAALDAVTEAMTVKLLADISAGARIIYTGTPAITLDLNGKTITSTADVALINKGGEMTITGEGTIDASNATDSDNDCVWAHSGNIIIKNGTFVNKSTTSATVYLTNASVFTIEGGTFKNLEPTFVYGTTTDTHYFGVLNVNNKSSVSQLVVKGGSFVGSDPAKGDDNLGGTFVADGYESVYNAEMKTYTVTEKTGPTSWTDINADTELSKVVSTETAAALEGSSVTAKDIADWATAKGVEFAAGISIDPEALILNCAPSQMAIAAAKDAVVVDEATMEAIMVAVAEGADPTKIEIPESVKAKYPMATIKLVPSTKIQSTDTAKFFQLSIELK